MGRSVKSEPPIVEELLADEEGTVVFPSLEEPLVIVPWRGAPPPHEPSPKPIPMVGSLLSQLRAVMGKVRAAVDKLGGTPSPEAAAAMNRVYAWTSAAELDVELAATAFALFRHAQIGVETLVRAFVAARDLDLALEAVVRGCERGVIVDDDVWPNRLVDGVTSFRGRTDGEARALAALEAARPGLVALRVLIASSDRYDAIARRAQSLLESTSVAASAVALAVILSEEDEIVAAAADGLEAVKLGSSLLLLSLRDVVRARRLVGSGALRVDDDAKSPAWTMIARVGPPAGSVLAALPDDERASAIGLFEAVRTPASFRALLPLVSSKQLGKRVQGILRGSPTVAASAIAPILTAKRHPDAASARAIAPMLESASIKALLSSNKDARPAPSGAVPPILVTPPWARPKQRRDAVAAIDIEPERSPIVRDAREGDLAPLAEYGDWGAKVDEHHGEKTRKEWEREIAEDQRHGRVIDLTLMSSGPVDLALEEWNGASEKRRLYYPNAWYGGAFAHAIAKRGPDFIPGLLKLLQLRPSGADRMPIEVIAPVLLCFDGAEIAEVLIAELHTGKKFRAAAESWFARRPTTTAQVAIPIALRGGKPAGNAIDALRVLVKRNEAEAVNAEAARYEAKTKEPILAALSAIVGIDPLESLPAKLPRLPSFFDPGALPPVLTNERHALPPSAVENLALMLAISQPDAPYAGIGVVREACDEVSLRDFAWALFETWMAASAPPKEMWILHGLGHLGDDEIARRITPLIRAWPGERAAARAVEGLSILANIGSDLSLMLLNGIAEKVKFASIQEGARARISEIAKRRGLSSEELADRLVPDLGLDARGETMLDFGSRSFKVTFELDRGSLAPRLFDEKNKPLASLPKPTPKDDAAKAKAAAARLSAMKKDVRAIATSRILRLEGAMIARRRWDEATFRSLFLDKPIVFMLARLLIWGLYENERLLTAFRVDVDRSLADDRDEPFELRSGGVGVVHPLDLSPELLDRWAKTLADYEIVQPFPQLGREVHHATEHDREGTHLESLVGIEVPAPKLVFGLEKAGYQRWAASDGGSFSGHSRAFAGGVEAHVEYEGAVGMGYIEEDELLTISKVRFTRAGDTVPIAAVDPVLLSEVIGGVRRIAEA